MGAVRLLRIVAPLALVVTLATACGSGSSSQGAGAPTTSPATVRATSSLELRPVYARYAQGIALGPSVPQALRATMSSVQCPTPPSVIEGMLLECDNADTVFLLNAPIVSGGVASATAKQVTHEKLWFVQITLQPAAKAQLDAALKSLTGTELAFSFDGSVVTSVVVDPALDTSKLAILGTYTEAQATKLAGKISSS
jgi:hypothetical protein